MGRLAGPASKQALAKAWKGKVKQELLLRKYLRPKPPVSVPSARNRQLALLWVLSTYKPNGLPVGYKGLPPFTPDMRELVRRGLASYKRVLTLGRSHNLISISEEGRKVVARSKVTDDLILYIANAFWSSSIR
jgi:hypothetical protein